MNRQETPMRLRNIVSEKRSSRIIQEYSICGEFTFCEQNLVEVPDIFISEKSLSGCIRFSYGQPPTLDNATRDYYLGPHEFHYLMRHKRLIPENWRKMMLEKNPVLISFAGCPMLDTYDNLVSILMFVNKEGKLDWNYHWMESYYPYPIAYPYIYSPFAFQFK